MSRQSASLEDEILKVFENELNTAKSMNDIQEVLKKNKSIVSDAAKASEKIFRIAGEDETTLYRLMMNAVSKKISELAEDEILKVFENELNTAKSMNDIQEVLKKNKSIVSDAAKASEKIFRIAGEDETTLYRLMMNAVSKKISELAEAELPKERIDAEEKIDENQQNFLKRFYNEIIDVRSEEEINENLEEFEEMANGNEDTIEKLRKIALEVIKNPDYVLEEKELPIKEHVKNAIRSEVTNLESGVKNLKLKPFSDNHNQYSVTKNLYIQLKKFNEAADALIERIRKNKLLGKAEKDSLSVRINSAKKAYKILIRKSIPKYYSRSFKRFQFFL